MTPKEKAEELVERMTVHHWTDVCDSEGAKQCALIAVDEILHSLSYKISSNIEELDYYNEVRKEIENLKNDE
jgi:hypothetical protein